MKNNSKHSAPSLASLKLLGQGPFLSILPVAVAALAGLGVKAHGASGTWNLNNSGSWGTAGNWTGGVPDAAGELADFSQLDITANRIVTLGANRTVGELRLGDLSGTNSYTISGANSLTLNQVGGAKIISSQSGGTNIISGTLLTGSNLTIEINGAGNLSLQGPVVNLANRTITNSGTGTGFFVFGGAQNTAITGPVTFIQDSPTSQLRFTNTNMGGNNYAGVFSVLRGTLYYASNRSDSMGTGTNTVTLGNPAGGSDDATFQVHNTSWGYNLTHPIVLAANTTGVLKIQRSGTTANTGTLSGGITGTNSLVIQNNGSGGSLALISNALNNVGKITNSGTGSGTVVIGGNIGTNVTELIQDSVTSRLILNNAKTFTGPTKISSGTLTLGSLGSISSSTSIDVASGATFDVSAVTAGFTVGSAQTLKGSGTVVGAVTLNNAGSTLSPGASPGILSFNTSQSWSSFNYDWELNNWAASVAGTNYDQIAITGGLTLDVAGAYTLDLLSLTSGNLSGNVANFTDTANSWSILTTTGGITNFDSSKWTINTGGFTSSPTWTGSWSIGQTGNNLVLTYTPVPEPAAALLGGLGTLLLLRRRRI
jgi:autotransporter-associated beta strand protein